VKILFGGDFVLDDSLYLLCTEMCVDGRYFQGGSVVSRWGIRGKDFFGSARRGGPGRTVRIPGKCGMRNAKRRMGNGEEWAYSEKKRRPRSEEQQQRWAKYGGFEWRPSVGRVAWSGNHTTTWC
jgi:hypothetical protein